jgi:transposase
VLDGRVIGRCMQRHRHQEFIRFLNAIEASVPAGKLIHAIANNYATHKHPKVRAWLVRHPRWTFHFMPTSASWLNAIEGFFAKLTKRRLKRGVFRSIVELQAAINRFLRETNDDPRPFRWTKDPDKIIAAVKSDCLVYQASFRLLMIRHGPRRLKAGASRHRLRRLRP